MIFSRYTKEKLFPLLVNRTVIILFVISLFTTTLYVTGIVRESMDSTQLSLLRLSSVLGIFLITTSICGIVLDFRRFLKTKITQHLFGACGYLALVFFGIVTVLAAMFIITVSGGNL